MPIVWLIAAAILVAVELHHLAFFAMFAAAGALAAAGTALVAPSHIVLQLIVAITVATAGIAMLRPFVSRAFAHRGSEARIGGVHGGLVAARGLTLDEIGNLVPGHVRLLGENWLAVTHDDEPIRPNTPVIVTSVTGTTLTVRAAIQNWELT